MDQSIDVPRILTQLVLLTSMGVGLTLVYFLWKFRFRNTEGYLHLSILVASFVCIIFEQWGLSVRLEYEWPHIMRATAWVPFLIGPSIWFFVQSLKGEGQPAGKTMALHYAPALLALLYHLPYYLQSGAAKLAQLEATVAIPVASSVLGTVKAVLLMAYLAAAYQELRRLNKKAGNRLTRLLIRAFLLFASIVAVIFIWFIAEHILGEFFAAPVDLIGAAALGLFIFLLTFWAITAWSDYLSSIVQTDSIGKRDAHQSLLDQDAVTSIYGDLTEQMNHHMWFREPGLKLDALAEQYGLPSHYLSYVINTETGQNYQRWLNGFRIAYFKATLAREPSRQMLDLAYASGFNSKAAFNRAFKDVEGCAPSDFRKSLPADSPAQ